MRNHATGVPLRSGSEHTGHGGIIKVNNVRFELAESEQKTGYDSKDAA